MTRAPVATGRSSPVGRAGGAPASGRLDVDRRIPAAAGFGLAAALAALAFGGFSLLLGLGSVAGLALIALPGGSRRYLLRRVVRLGSTVLVAMAIIWFLVHNYPDAARSTPAGVVPAMERYVTWLGDALLGEMGDTQYSETVGEGLARTIPISFQLVAYSQVLALLVAVPGAIIGARFRGKLPDVGFRAITMLTLAVPMFVFGLIMMYLFGVGRIRMFGWDFGIKILPTGRYVPFGRSVVDHFRSVALPSLTLATTTAASYLILLRAEILQQLGQEHVQLARSKGLSPLRIIRSHGLRPAGPTVVAAIGTQTGLLFGNLLVIERIFTLPGFGDYVLVAIGRRDDLAVVGSLFVIALILAVVNLFADAILLAVDPRLRE